MKKFLLSLFTALTIFSAPIVHAQETCVTPEATYRQIPEIEASLSQSEQTKVVLDIKTYRGAELNSLLRVLSTKFGAPPQEPSTLVTITYKDTTVLILYRLNENNNECSFAKASLSTEIFNRLITEASNG